MIWLGSYGIFPLMFLSSCCGDFPLWLHLLLLLAILLAQDQCFHEAPTHAEVLVVEEMNAVVEESLCSG